ncbi:sigma-70 family RNA polymerase sigma factor [Nonomuraea purpurea]|uniref:Sigma-70 family RNA polymerase sigma factor n=1 Tax=Nonomuraea purpurea TaxID=1849276 RepID=A0ABV8GRC0_9ACTN
MADDAQDPWTMDLREAEAAFRAARPRLFGIAYRILGSVSEADDVLQEVWIRWQTYDRSGVRNAEAFLATTTTRLAINVLQSARVRRESYVGPWLPEPVDTSADPALGAERGEALEVATLMLLERLTPTERASYVLREAFDYPYDEIAEIIGHSPASVRQLVSRARRHLADERRASVATAEHKRFLTAFVAAAVREDESRMGQDEHHLVVTAFGTAWESGDAGALSALLDPDVTALSDGGGNVRTARRPVRGASRTARFLIGVVARRPGVEMRSHAVNGRTGLVLRQEEVVVGVMSCGVRDGRITDVWLVLNPDKLRGWND